MFYLHVLLALTLFSVIQIVLFTTMANVHFLVSPSLYVTLILIILMTKVQNLTNHFCRYC